MSSFKAKEATTTLKLDTCSFTETKIYPGRGSIFISRDGKAHIFSNARVKSLFHQKKKPAKLTWTQAWRRANKKATANTGVGKKKTRATVRIQKAIVGLSLDDLQKKKAAAAAKHAPSTGDNKKDAAGGRPPLPSKRATKTK